MAALVPKLYATPVNRHGNGRVRARLKCRRLALAGFALLASLPTSRVGARAVDGACDLPLLKNSSSLVVLNHPGGTAVSTVAVAGLDKPTTTGSLEIGPGRGEIQLVIFANEPFIVRLKGQVGRISRLIMVQRSGAGATGIAASKVRFVTDEECYPSSTFAHARRTPDRSFATGGLHRGWTDGRSFRDAEPPSPEWGKSTSQLAEDMASFYPGGIVDVDPATVVASQQPLKYRLLPNEAGALELERQGVLVKATANEIEEWRRKAKLVHGERLIGLYGIPRGAYRVTRPTEIPAGLCGAHSLAFLVPSRDYLIGDICHSDVLRMDGRILAPSNWADEHDCGIALFEQAAQPHAPGPLRLSRILCNVTRKLGSDGGEVLSPSPNGRWMAFLPWHYKRLPLRLQEMAHGSEPRDLQVTSTHYFQVGGQPGARWNTASDAIWFAKPISDTENGSGAVEAVRLGLDGKLTRMPALSHSNGPLNGLFWIGGDGQAIASFRTIPPVDPQTHKILPPTYAMVDTASGQVLDSFDAKLFEALKAANADAKDFFHTGSILATKLPDGRVRALLDLKRWVLWDQGEQPRIVDLPQASAAELSADGKTAFLLRPNLPGEDNRGWFVSCDGEGGRHGPCPKREPRDGTWASLHDVGTGKLIWALRWTFDRYDRLSNFTVSPDGRLAVVAVLSRADPNKHFLAVLSMRDGRVLQTLPPPRGDYSMGFSAGGTLVWISSWRGTLLYSTR